MTPEDTARILARVQAYDRRTIGRADVSAWHDTIGDLDPDACHRAVVAHYRDETSWLMPAHVRQLVAAEARAAGERRRSEQLRQLLDSAEATPAADRSEPVQALFAELRRRLPAVPAAVAFSRPEWRDADRTRRPDRVGDADQPNPHFVAPPPLGGFPVPSSDVEEPS